MYHAAWFDTAKIQNLIARGLMPLQGPNRFAPPLTRRFSKRALNAMTITPRRNRAHAG